MARINLLFCQISILWIRSNQSLASFSSSAAISSAEAKVPGPKFSRSNFSLRSLESRIDDGDLVKLLTGCVSAADDRKPLLLSFDASVTKKGQIWIFFSWNWIILHILLPQFLDIKEKFNFTKLIEVIIDLILAGLVFTRSYFLREFFLPMADTRGGNSGMPDGKSHNIRPEI